MASFDAPEDAMCFASFESVNTVYGRRDSSIYRPGSAYGRWSFRSQCSGVLAASSIIVDMTLQCVFVASRRYAYTGVTASMCV